MNKHMNQRQNLNYWEQNASKYSGHFVSWWDVNMKKIEVNTLLPWIKSSDYILDVGCSNGSSTKELHIKTGATFYGIDYSKTAIRQAQMLTNKKLKFKYTDILKFDQTNAFDKVITIRCLINIMDKKSQLKALRNIHSALKPKGLYLMCEGFMDGYINLNRAREFFQLKPLKAPKHNLYFEEKAMPIMVKDLFRIKKVINHASLYYLGTRVLQYLSVNKNKEIEKNSVWNNFFGQFGFTTDKSGDFSPNKVYILQKI